MAAEALRSGHYLAQVEHLKDGYRRKRDTVLASLERYMPKADGLHWTHPHGGLYVWLTLPETFDTSREGMFADATKAGVLYVPGNYCFQPDENGRIPRNHLRLCFGNVPADKVESGIEKLAGVVREKLSPTATGAVTRGHDAPATVR
jgi:2-aminoadipate transaminase